mmetsp:Transcript_34146/g.113022  ORF Transcript_34146/g.113022 Transcript_34146/m.113022 type:complete len:369 (-) Transcript_34146:1252-2358(-)
MSSPSSPRPTALWSRTSRSASAATSRCAAPSPSLSPRRRVRRPSPPPRGAPHLPRTWLQAAKPSTPAAPSSSPPPARAPRALAAARGALLLRLPARDGEHPLGDILSPHRHSRQGPVGARPPLWRNQRRALRRTQGAVGAQVDRRASDVWRAARRVRRRGRHLLLGLVLRAVLAQEARADARPHLLERAHLARRGAALRLRLPALLQAGASAAARAGARDHPRGGRDRARLRHRRAPRLAHRHERAADDAVHRVCRRPPPRRARRRRALGRGQPVRLDGPHLDAGQDKLLRAARRRVPKGGRHGRRPAGWRPRVHARRRLLILTRSPARPPLGLPPSLLVVRPQPSTKPPLQLAASSEGTAPCCSRSI